MIPPAMRHLPPKTKTPVITLSPDIDDDAPTTSGTGDSGYSGAEEWKQHMHHPPPLKASKLYQIICICLQGYRCTFVNSCHSCSVLPTQQQLGYAAITQCTYNYLTVG